MSGVIILVPGGGGSGPQTVNAQPEVGRQPSGFDSGQFILRTPVPIEPSATLPELSIEGVQAQVDGMSVNANGDWDVVLVSGPVSKGADFDRYQVSDKVGTPPAMSLHNDDLSGLRLTMDVANIPEPFECDFMNFAPGEVIYSGPYLETTRYWAPFVRTSGGSEQVMMVIAFVTRRADLPVYELEFFVTNGKCDVTESPFDTQDAIDGNVHFKSILLTGLSELGGWQSKANVNRPLALLDNQGTPDLVAEMAASEHVIGPAQGFVRRMVIGDPSLHGDEMKDIAEWRDRGVAFGPNSYFMKQAFGETKCLVPHPAPAFVWGGQSGHRAICEFDRLRYYIPSINALATGGTGGIIKNGERGWQVPNKDPNGNASGAPLQQTFLGWHQNFWAHNVYRMDMEARLERGNCYAYTINPGSSAPAGHPVDLHGWSRNNSPTHVAYDGSTPGAVDKFPWDSCQVTTKNTHMNPLFYHPAINGGQPPQLALLPTSRPWNNPSPGTGVPWASGMLKEQQGQGAAAYFEQHYGTHSGRTYVASMASYWSTGDVIAREHIRATAAWFIGPNDYGVQGLDRSNGFNRGPQHAFDMPADREFITANGYQNQVPCEWYRNVSRRATVALMRYCIETDPAWRALDRARWEAFADLWDMQVNGRGMVCRSHPRGLTGDDNNDCFEEAIHGTTNVGARTGAVPDTSDGYPSGNTVAGEDAWDVGKSWMQATMGNTGHGLMRAVFDAGADPVRYAFMQTHVTNMWESFWATQDVNASEGRVDKYMTIGTSNKTQSHPVQQSLSQGRDRILTTFGAQQNWNNPDAWNSDVGWYHMGVWHLSSFNLDPNEIEHDAMLRGNFDPAAGVGNQDLEAYCEARWASMSNQTGGESVSVESNNTHMHNAAPSLAHVQLLLGLQEQWMNAS
ncbi:MAG: hypothetical protein GY711_11300 [bacterium]|nr:hypothetical protein [bacterium]